MYDLQSTLYQDQSTFSAHDAAVPSYRTHRYVSFTIHCTMSSARNVQCSLGPLRALRAAWAQRPRAPASRWLARAARWLRGGHRRRRGLCRRGARGRHRRRRGLRRRGAPPGGRGTPLGRRRRALPCRALAVSGSAAGRRHLWRSIRRGGCLIVTAVDGGRTDCGERGRCGRWQRHAPDCARLRGGGGLGGR